MQPESEEVLLEHTLRIDKYIEVSLKIPKVLTPDELMALTLKAGKLFRMSEVEIKPKAKASPQGINQEQKDFIISEKKRGTGMSELWRKYNSKFNAHIGKAKLAYYFYDKHNRLASKKAGA